MAPVSVQHYLILAAVLFCLGAFGVMIRRNALSAFADAMAIVETLAE